MIHDRNKLPTYQLILMPRSTSRNGSTPRGDDDFVNKLCFPNFVNSIIRMCWLWLAFCEHPTSAEKMLTHHLLYSY